MPVREGRPPGRRAEQVMGDLTEGHPRRHADDQRRREDPPEPPMPIVGPYAIIFAAASAIKSQRAWLPLTTLAKPPTARNFF